ncbi:hypothetical protein EC957_002276 [Mortierella hygrophila]|uniref:Uncharacterized protein n=1 Tax=Mortierella hygrophila TaxID=979708 RepID=A0A9P6K1P6_9FUNG|nr:hypothetical protein EC957_002276 [Mortierella hygrophila]
MKSATTRFFDLPELIPLIGIYLEQHDLSAFMKTSHLMHAILLPLFHRVVHLPTFRTPETLQALARNAMTISHLTTGLTACGRYSDIVTKAFQSKDPSIKFKKQIPTYIPSEEALEALCQGGEFPAQLYQVLRLSPRLTQLDLVQICINNDLTLHLLARVISGLDTLESLLIATYANARLFSQIPSYIFNSCPPSLKSLEFKILYNHIASRATTFSTNATPDSNSIKTLKSSLAIPGPGRQVRSLSNLTQWRFMHDDVDDLSDTICSILESCPNLRSMDVPPLGGPQQIERLKRMVANCLPHLQSLTQHDLEHGHMNDCTAISIVANAMRLDTLELVYILQYAEKYPTIDQELQRHKRSLRWVELDDCTRIESSTITSLLLQYPALEVLKVNPFENTRSVEVDIEQLVEKKWVVTRLRELQLIINTEPGEIDEEEKYESDRRKNLENLCRQLGAIESLEVLDLWVPSDEDGAYDDYENDLGPRFSLSGMLSLGDKEVGGERWGCLGLLAGLKNLLAVRGSFFIQYTPVSYNITQEDAEFIVKHWPRLKVLELCRESERFVGLSPPVEYLLQELPGLCIFATERY